jgi:hypothetical protein
MNTPWIAGDYAFHFFGIFFSGCVAFSPRPTLRLIFRRHADAVSDERIGVLRGLAFVTCASLTIDAVMQLLR